MNIVVLYQAGSGYDGNQNRSGKNTLIRQGCPTLLNPFDVKCSRNGSAVKRHLRRQEGCGNLSMGPGTGARRIYPR